MTTLPMMLLATEKTTKPQIFDAGNNIQVIPEQGLALAPVGVLVQMGYFEFDASIAVDINGAQSLHGDTQCVSSGATHITKAAAKAVFEKLVIDLKMSMTGIDFQVIKLGDLNSNVSLDQVEFVNSEWGQALRMVKPPGDQPYSDDRITSEKPNPALTKTTTSSPAAQPVAGTTTTVTSSQSMTVTTAKTTSTSTQPIWEGPWYPEGSEYTQYDDERLVSECCANCLCLRVGTENDEFLKIPEGKNQWSIHVDGFGENGQITSSQRYGTTVIVVRSGHGTILMSVSMAIEPQWIVWSNGKLVFKMHAVSEMMVVVHLNIINCPYCDDVASVVVEPIGRIRRSILKNLFDIESHSEFVAALDKIKESQELFQRANALDFQKLNFMNKEVLMHEDHLQTTVVNIRDRFCELQAEVKQVNLEVQVNEHANEIAQEVVSIVETCNANKMPRALMSSEKIAVLCENSYPGKCNGPFLRQYKSAITCQITKVVITEASIVIGTKLKTPMGPRVPYRAFRLLVVPVYHKDQASIFRAATNTIVVKTEDHMTTIEKCEEVPGVGSFKCNINDVNQKTTTCLAKVIGKSADEYSKWCYDQQKIQPGACNIVQNSLGLLVSASMPLQMTNTKLSLNGFRSDEANSTHQGVFFVKAVDSTTSVTCNGMVYSTPAAPEEIEVVLHDGFKNDAVVKQLDVPVSDIKSDQHDIEQLMHIQVLKHNITMGNWITPAVGWSVLSVSLIAVTVIVLACIIIGCRWACPCMNPCGNGCWCPQRRHEGLRYEATNM